MIEFFITSKKSKFAAPPVPIKQRINNFAKSMAFWKGRKKGMIYTQDITWDDLRVVFAPRNFTEKYSYLGSVPYGDEMIQAMEPLVIFMDYKARPKWCPRWFLRFLRLFGSDNSIVRVRNRTLYNLQQKLTKGYLITDYKTKWDWYDLRISVYGNEQMNDLADAIESRYYSKGERIDVANRIKNLDPSTKFDCGYSIGALRKELERLEKNC